MGAAWEEAASEGEEALQEVGLRLRVCPPYHGETYWLILPTVNLEAFSPALKHFAKGVGAGEDKRILLVLDQAGWHTGGEVSVPEGIHLEFLPARSPELMLSERLWSLINERVANRLFEEMDDLEEALVERCLSLSEQSKSVRVLGAPCDFLIRRCSLRDRLRARAGLVPCGRPSHSPT